jgi:PAS domain S-box-containing protein
MIYSLVKKALPRKLRAQVGLIVSILLASTIGLYAWHMSREQAKNVTTSITNEAAITAKNIADLTVPYMLTEDYASMETLLVKLSELPAILAVSVCESDADPASQVIHPPGETPRVFYTTARCSLPAGTQPVTILSDDRITAWHPITDGSLLGWVKVEYSLQMIKELRLHVWKNAFLLGLLAATISVCLILLFLNRHIRAVGAITEFANRLDERIGGTIDASDGSLETEQLVSALNQASRKLRDQDRSLKESAENIDLLRRRNLLILESAGEGIIGLDPEGRHSFVNPAAAAMLGYEIKELLGRRFYESWYRVTADYSEFKESLAAEALRNGIVHHVDSELFWRKDGTSFPAAYTVTPVREGTAITGAVLTFRDVTEREQAEAALRDSERKYRTLFEESKDVVFFSTVEGRFIDINQAGIELFGYSSKEELREINIAKNLYVDPKGRDAFRRIIERYGYIKEYEIRLRRKSGEPIICQMTATAVRDDRGATIAYRGILRDVTSERQLEEQLRHAQKMEAVGQLTAGISHDFNNILTAIIGFAYVLQEDLPQDSALRFRAEQILSAAQRAAGLTASLLTFSSKQITNPRQHSLNEIVNRMRDLLIRLAGEAVKVTIRLTPDNPMIMADSGQLDQVLMNLASNARDAMPGGGELTITTQLVELDEPFIAVRGFGRTGRFALLTVTDTGTGIEERTLKRMFEPFFTTKPVGKGTGLGLSIVYGIVSRHGGYVDVQSRPGEGTSFLIYFPLHQAATEGDRQIESMASVRGTETILLAEDDKDLRRLNSGILTDRGFTVIEAKDGDEAVAKFQAHRGKIDLLVLDVFLPRKNGKEAYDQIRALEPSIKVLFTSGYPLEFVQQRGIVEDAIPFLAKPVAPPLLLHKIRDVLDARSVFLNNVRSS